MLKQIKLRNRLRGLKKELEAIRNQKEQFKVREQELEAAANEAENEEDLKVVDDEITKLEEEMKAAGIEESEKSIEEEVRKIEEQLEELEKKASEANEKKDGMEEKREEKGEIKMRNRKAFGNMTREQQALFMEREEVKQFIVQVREKKGQKRSVSGAELTIPTIVLDLLRDNLHRYSKLCTEVRLKPVPGTARQHIMGTIPEGIWTEAVGKLNELDFTINQIETDGYKVGGFIPIDNSTLEDADIDLMAEILDMLGQAIGIAVDKAILYGTGKKMPLGIATRLSQVAKPSDWADEAPEWKDLSTTNILKFDGSSLTGTKFFEHLILSTGAAKANYSDGKKIWCMNSTTKAIIMSKALAFNAAGALVAAVDGTMPVIGGKIIELEFIPDGDVFFGYSSLYLLVERAGGTFAVADQVRFIEDQTVYKGTARYDGQPVFGIAFILMNIKNTAPTTSVVFAPDNANAAEEGV